MLSKTQILPVGEKKSAYELSQKETHEVQHYFADQHLLESNAQGH